MNKKWIMMSLVACVAGLSSVYAEEEISAVQEEKNFGCPCGKDKKPDTTSFQEEEKLLTQNEEETDKFFGIKDSNEEEKLLTQNEEETDKFFGIKDSNEEESVSKFLSCKDCK